MAGMQAMPHMSARTRPPFPPTTLHPPHLQLRSERAGSVSARACDLESSRTLTICNRAQHERGASFRGRHGPRPITPYRPSLPQPPHSRSGLVKTYDPVARAETSVERFRGDTSPASRMRFLATFRTHHPLLAPRTHSFAEAIQLVAALPASPHSRPSSSNCPWEKQHHHSQAKDHDPRTKHPFMYFPVLTGSHEKR